MPNGKSAIAVCEKIRAQSFFLGHREIQFAVVCDVTREHKAVLEDLDKAQVIFMIFISNRQIIIFMLTYHLNAHSVKTICPHRTRQGTPASPSSVLPPLTHFPSPSSEALIRVNWKHISLPSISGLYVRAVTTLSVCKYKDGS